MIIVFDKFLERELFQSGRKQIAIISDASSTGFCLHDDGKKCSSRQRVHITIELPWSAEKTIQQLGRTNRTNQLTKPKYILVTTPICGETRFASGVTKKLEQLVNLYVI